MLGNNNLAKKKKTDLSDLQCATLNYPNHVFSTLGDYYFFFKTIYISSLTLVPQCEYSKTSLIQAAWDQGVPRTKKMPITANSVYYVQSCTQCLKLIS